MPFLRLFPLVVALCALYTHVNGAYTYQKLNELMPELRQYLGRTHLGTLRPLSGQQRGGYSSFLDDDQIQFRERKSNNLRNLMRIGKRHLPGSGGLAPASDEAPAGGMGAVYYFSPSFPNDNQFQPYRPQSVWL